MDIGKTIYTLRKSKNMTQDQLAQAVGVSTPAVSKWETGSTYPDITILSPLARALGTTIDYLLSYQQELSEEEINKIKLELRLSCEENGFRAGMEKCKEYLKEYPNSDHLKLDIARMSINLAYTLDQDYTDEEYNELGKEITKLYEQVAKSDDKNLSMIATIGLATRYMQEERYDESEVLLHSLPKNEINAEQLLPTLYLMKEDYSKAAKMSQRALLHDVQSVLNGITTLYTVAKRKEQLDKAAFYANNYVNVGQIFGMQTMTGADLMVDVHLLKGNIKEAITWFEHYIDNIIELKMDLKDNEFFEDISEEIVVAPEKVNGIKRGFLKAITMNPNYEIISDRDEYKRGVQKLTDHVKLLG